MRAGFRGALTIARNFQMNGARGAKREMGDGNASVLARIDPGGEIDPLRTCEEGELPQLRPECAFGKTPKRLRFGR